MDLEDFLAARLRICLIRCREAVVCNRTVSYTCGSFGIPGCAAAAEMQQLATQVAASRKPLR
jgi:hypothetical protein